MSIHVDWVCVEVLRVYIRFSTQGSENQKIKGARETIRGIEFES